MSTPFGPMRLIVNPRAGRGSARADVAALADQLRARGLDFDIRETDGAGSATRIARASLEEGVRYLVAVGGDGTVHEVVNGMIAEDKPIDPEAVLGVYGAGSGCDFIRTFGLNRRPDVVAAHLASEDLMPIDIGKAVLTGLDGDPLVRYFPNIAEVGYGAEAVRRAAGYPRWLGRVRYLFAAWGAIRGIDRQETEIQVDERTVRRGLVNLVVANCQFFGGGMKVAPRALPDDGLFNVQVFHGKASQVFTLTSKIYKGEHIPNEHISEFQSPQVSVAPDRPMLVEADGEVLGRTPATFSLLDKALRLKI